MNKKIIIIVVLVLLSLAYAWNEARTPRPTDWKESYASEAKSPYGTYIVRQSLSQLFPGSSVRPVRISPAQQLTSLSGDLPATYVFINRRFDCNTAELDELLDFVGQGNRLFIAAGDFPEALLSRCSLHYDFSPLVKWDHRLTGQGLSDKVYSFGWPGRSFFISDTNFAGEILGVAGLAESPDFVRIPYQKGTIFLNLNPKAFTNYGVLDSECGDYYYKALSYIPDDGGVVMWDDYQTQGAAGSASVLRVLLKERALRLAVYLTLVGGLLYVLFRTKREQRAIPVVRPAGNRMLEFVRSVSSLYYKKKDHSSLARKRIDYFMDDVRSRYHMRTEVLDDEFAQMLSERSGIEKEELKQLLVLILKAQSHKNLEEEELKRMVRNMEHLK